MPESCVSVAFAFAFGAFAFCAFCVSCVLRFVRFAFWLRFEECYANSVLRFGCVLKLGLRFGCVLVCGLKSCVCVLRFCVSEVQLRRANAALSDA